MITKKNILEYGFVSILRWKHGETSAEVGLTERVILNQWKTCASLLVYQLVGSESQEDRCEKKSYSQLLENTCQFMTSVMHIGSKNQLYAYRLL
jgi:hypothetical protein